MSRIEVVKSSMTKLIGLSVGEDGTINTITSREYYAVQLSKNMAVYRDQGFGNMHRLPFMEIFSVKEIPRILSQHLKDSYGMLISDLKILRIHDDRVLPFVTELNIYQEFWIYLHID